MFIVLKSLSLFIKSIQASTVSPDPDIFGDVFIYRNHKVVAKAVRRRCMPVVSDVVARINEFDAVIVSANPNIFVDVLKQDIKGVVSDTSPIDIVFRIV